MGTHDPLRDVPLDDASVLFFSGPHPFMYKFGASIQLNEQFVNILKIHYGRDPADFYSGLRDRIA